ncbi:MAG: hypothetical protein IPN70_02070 [Candidatus Moraniibacteriota bacterium]|nr:MAG: hypothetical protein IPN70_02070 [Candidatus Moranbacteria bacterium]
MENQSVKIVFNEFQTDLLIGFFSDLEKLRFKNQNNRTVSINPNKHDGSWVFDMDPYVPAINEAFSQNLGKIKYFDRLIEGFSSSNLYPIVKSKDSITDCIEKLSQKYGLTKIPLIYTTVLFPSKDNLPALVWAELSSIGCFEEKYFGHIDFINAVLELKKEKNIEIKGFEIMNLDGAGFTFKIILALKKELGTHSENKLSDAYEISIKDREIWINNTYLIGKPHGAGSNMEFFSFLFEHPNKFFRKSELPDGIKNEIKSKKFSKILNSLGFKGEILKAFFPKRSTKTGLLFNKVISDKDIEERGIKKEIFLRELELANIRNNPK